MAAASPTSYAINSNVTFRAGPTKVERSGTVIGHEGQFVLVKVGEKTLKTRPGAIVS